jgi:PIN domain nuclease of toxin-antitoxin system
MRLLLDSHILLWLLADDKKLPRLARTRIRKANSVLVSSATLWELSIKVGMGRLNVNMLRLVESIDASGLTELPVQRSHALMLLRLPDFHRDPFDRLLVAQAIAEGLTLMTNDETVAKYPQTIQV